MVECTYMHAGIYIHEVDGENLHMHIRMYIMNCAELHWPCDTYVHIHMRIYVPTYVCTYIVNQHNYN